MTEFFNFLFTLSPIDYTVLGVNLVLFIFAKPIASRYQRSTDKATIKNRIRGLRIANLLLFTIFISEFFFSHWAKQLSQTGLTLLLAFLGVHFLKVLILAKYGRTKEIDNVEHRSETYQSEIFGLLIVFITTIATILFIINIWGMTDWLKTTSVLGGLLIIAFSTKDVWAPDNINGLILLYNGNIEPGSVIKVDDCDLLAITIQTTLTQTVFRDLRSKHQIILPNSRLRSSKIEILSKCPGSGLMQTIDFKIGYGFTIEEIESFFAIIWERACDAEKSINQEKPFAVKLLENGDHAVVWRFCYWVKNLFGLYDAAFAVNREAYRTSLEKGISLDTPMTHSVSVTPDATNQLR
ncbi:MAG: hypothetical protein V3V31_10055 [Methylococcales bacterium]